MLRNIPLSAIVKDYDNPERMYINKDGLVCGLYAVHFWEPLLSDLHSEQRRHVLKWMGTSDETCEVGRYVICRDEDGYIINNEVAVSDEEMYALVTQ